MIDHLVSRKQTAPLGQVPSGGEKQRHSQDYQQGKVPDDQQSGIFADDVEEGSLLCVTEAVLLQFLVGITLNTIFSHDKKPFQPWPTFQTSSCTVWPCGPIKINQIKRKGHFIMLMPHLRACPTIMLSTASKDKFFIRGSVACFCLASS